MAELWPSALQDKVNEAGFQHEFGKTAIESAMDIGLNKKRQRYTKAIDKFSVTLTLDFDDYGTLYTFFKTTLAGGTRNFLYDHPFTGVETEFRMNEPKMSPMGGKKMRVNMVWELVP